MQKAAAPTESTITHPSSFSPTALSTYEQCPRRYQHAYLLKTPAEDPPSPHLVFGNALHKALAFLFRLPVKDRDVDIAQRALRHFWAKTRREEREAAFLTPDEEQQWGLEALEIMARFCTERSEELTIGPLAVEEWVRGPTAGGFSVGGKVDRVDRLELPGADADAEPLVGLRVTDYKTGKARITDPDDLAADRAAQIYALATTHTIRQPVIAVRLLYLREHQAVTWEVEQEDLAVLAQLLGKALERLTVDRTFEPRPDFLCRWCPYRSVCPEGSGQACVDQLDKEPATSF
jgi:putative RecB family exonuclease